MITERNEILLPDSWHAMVAQLVKKSRRTLPVVNKYSDGSILIGPYFGRGFPHPMSKPDDHSIRAWTERFNARALRYRLKRLKLQFNMKGFMTKFAIFVFLLALCVPASAQTVEVGPSVIRSSNYAPPDGASGGGNTFPGVYAKAVFDLPKGFEVQAKVRASRTPPLQTQFTTDEPEHKPAASLSINPEVRYNLGRFFVAPGVEFSKQFFTDDDPGEYYSRSHNLNPTAAFGARLTKRQEASFTYLFKDRYTDLYGYRANYSYVYPVSEKVSIVIGAEANYYTFRETNREGYRDPYYESDTVFLFDLAIRFGKRKHRY